MRRSSAGGALNVGWPKSSAWRAFARCSLKTGDYRTSVVEDGERVVGRRFAWTDMNVVLTSARKGGSRMVDQASA